MNMFKRTDISGEYIPYMNMYYKIWLIVNVINSQDYNFSLEILEKNGWVIDSNAVDKIKLRKKIDDDNTQYGEFCVGKRVFEVSSNFRVRKSNSFEHSYLESDVIYTPLKLFWRLNCNGNWSKAYELLNVKFLGDDFEGEIVCSGQSQFDYLNNLKSQKAQFFTSGRNDVIKEFTSQGKTIGNSDAGRIFEASEKAINYDNQLKMAEGRMFEEFHFLQLYEILECDGDGFLAYDRFNKNQLNLRKIEEFPPLGCSISFKLKMKEMEEYEYRFKLKKLLGLKNSKVDTVNEYRDFKNELDDLKYIFDQTQLNILNFWGGLLFESNEFIMERYKFLLESRKLK